MLLKQMLETIFEAETLAANFSCGTLSTSDDTRAKAKRLGDKLNDMRHALNGLRAVFVPLGPVTIEPIDGNVVMFLHRTALASKKETATRITLRPRQAAALHLAMGKTLEIIRLQQEVNVVVDVESGEVRVDIEDK